MKSTKILSVSALMAALCVVILALGSLMESLDISLSIIAGLVVMILATEYGDRTALSVFAVVSVISVLLPMKSAGVLFFAFFGWYPILQKKLRILKPMLCRILSFLLFNGVMILLFILSAYFVGLESYTVYGLLIVLGNVCFYFYDILLDRFLIWYLLKLRRHLRF